MLFLEKAQSSMQQEDKLKCVCVCVTISDKRPQGQHGIYLADKFLE